MDWNHQLVVCPCWVIWREVSVINKIWCLASRWDQLGPGSQRANQLALNNWKVNLPVKLKGLDSDESWKINPFLGCVFSFLICLADSIPIGFITIILFTSIWENMFGSLFPSILRLKSRKIQVPCYGIAQDYRCHVCFLVILESLKILYPKTSKCW